jgi:SAM-dependent methyltransferase
MSRKLTAEQLLGMVRSFQPTCVIVAGAELDVFTKLRARPMTAVQLSAKIGADERAMTALLDALAALKVLAKSGRRYRVPPAVGQVLVEGGKGCQLGMVRHLANCLRRWDQLARVVKTGRPADREPSILGEAGDTESFIRAMHEVSDPMAGPLVRAVKVGKFRHLLDVGGGSGTWTIAFLRAASKAKATIFDLPDVIPMARRRMARAGLSGRVRLVGGDLEVDELPKSADLAWVSAIVHMNSRRQNRRLFGKVFRALEPGGRVLIRDIVMEPSRIAPPSGALFAVNMLVATEGGGTFTFDELRDDLKSAGFAKIRLIRRTEGMDSVVEAMKLP